VTTAESFGTIDFGFTEAEEQRATRLHESAVIVDLLFQGPCGYRVFSDAMCAELQHAYEQSGDTSGVLRQAIKTPIDLAIRDELPEFRECWEASGVTAGNRQIEPGDFRFFALTAGMAQAQFDRLDWLDKALTADDIVRAKKEGRRAGIVSTQLTYGPPPSPDQLPALHDLGLRICGLTYNVDTAWASGCTAASGGGLTDTGKDVVRRLNALGIVIDVSHASMATVRDTCAVSERPVVATHSGADAVFGHARNLPDELAVAIAETGGVIGVPTVPFFLSGAPDADVSSWLDHVDHLVSVVGVDHVAIGTDWPMQLPKWALEVLLMGEARATGFREEDRLDVTRNLHGFDDYRDFPNLTRGLVARGYDDTAVLAVLGSNALRVFENVWG
jgi:membrane dipeptidase